jgi:hypothetical protein
MTARLFRAELLKIKGKGLWLLAVLGPLGVVGLQAVNCGVRKDYLFAQSDDRWGYYLLNVASFTPLALVLGIVILTSFMAFIEEETGAWKTAAALPVPKSRLFLAKALVPMTLLLLSSGLLALFTLAHGMLLKLGGPVPWSDLTARSLLPFFAALPILALQYWLSVASRHQGVAVTAGVLGFLLTYNAHSLPDWLIWKWPVIAGSGDGAARAALAGMAAGLALIAAGMGHFSRKDVM